MMTSNLMKAIVGNERKTGILLLHAIMLLTTHDTVGSLSSYR
jgi:hypothetical protein